MLFKKLSSWLKGRFVCKKCGKVFHIMSLGFGEAICPECFDGEEEFIHFDENYWLNKLSAQLFNREKSRKNV